MHALHGNQGWSPLPSRLFSCAKGSTPHTAVMGIPLLVLVSLATFAFSALAQTTPKTPQLPPKMVMYQFVMLRAGTNTSQPGAEAVAKMQQ